MPKIRLKIKTYIVKSDVTFLWGSKDQRVTGDSQIILFFHQIVKIC